MDDVAGRLHRALFDAFGPYVLDRLARRSMEPPPSFAGQLERAAASLAADLGTLLVRPFPEQEATPLELFRRAVDDVVAPLAPVGDLERGPASSQELGEEAWHAHLAWGRAKAAALASPDPGRAGLLTRNLMDRTRIGTAVRSAGLRFEAWSDGAAAAEGVESGVVVVVVDLEHPDAPQVLERAVRDGARTIAFGPHVATESLERARAAGAVALARSVFFRRLPGVLNPAE